MKPDHAIDYLEFPSRDLEATKAFFTALAGWNFQDYGPEYTAFEDGKATGGFYLSKAISSADLGAPLVVLYHSDLEAVQEKVTGLGGKITKEIFSFPADVVFSSPNPAEVSSPTGPSKSAAARREAGSGARRFSWEADSSSSRPG